MTGRMNVNHYLTDKATKAACVGMLQGVVVLTTLLGIRKGFVCFVYLLKFFFAGFIAGVQVGMILPCKLAVSCLNFVLRGGFGYPQDFVIVLCHSHLLSVAEDGLPVRKAPLRI